MLAQCNKIVYYKLRLQKGRCVMDFTVIILVFIIILQLAVIFMLYRSRAGAGLSEEALEEKVEMAIALCDGLTFRLIANPTMDRERVARAVADVIVR